MYIAGRSKPNYRNSEEREGLVVKNMFCSCRRPISVPNTPAGHSDQSVHPNPGYLMPSSGRSGHMYPG